MIHRAIVRAFLAALFLFAGTRARAGNLPQERSPLLQTHEGIYQTGPAAAKTAATGKIVTVTVYGQNNDGGTTLIDYELSCANNTFRQLRVIEELNGRQSQCTNPSEPIALNPAKHVVARTLFDTFCR